MAGICITSVRLNGAGCDHRDITVSLDGESITLHTGEAEVDALPWGDDEKRQFLLWCLKRQRLGALAFDNLPGRVVHGEEATNVKQYMLVAKDITKTNIGTSYVNVPVGANGERSLVEFTGCTEYRVVLTANLVGTGPFGFRIVRDGDSAVLFENASIAQTGERELDTDWQPIPGGVEGLTLLRLQAKSAVAADDPVVRRCVVLVR